MKFFATILVFLLLWGGGLVFAQAATSAEVLLTQVGALLSELKFDEAIALFDTLPAAERDSSRYRLLRASILNSAGRYAEAAEIAEAVRRAEPGNTEALFVLSAVEGAQGRVRQQQTLLENIISIDPGNTEALIELGKINLRARSLRNAAANFHQVFSIDPNNLEALIGMGQVLRFSREWGEAELFFNRAVELYPRDPEVWSERARFHRARGQRERALEDLNEAVRLAPSNYWTAMDRGTLLFEMDNRSLALQEFNRAIRINPGEAQAYIYSSALKDYSGDLDGAAHDYMMLSTLMPEYYFAFEGLGLHLMRTEQWADARDAFMEAYRRAPDEHLYALLAAVNWIRIDLTGPRQFLSQAMRRIDRDSLEWFMFRIFYDMTARSNVGERDMTMRIDRETNETLKARMLFYMAQYYDIQGSVNLANRHYIMIRDMGVRAIPEWRLVEWILASRNIHG